MGNALYHKYEDAKNAMAQEINDARENFTDLETLSDMACYYEARDEDARLHQGYVIIAHNEGVDYYEIYLQKSSEPAVKIAEDIDFTQLGDCIDTAIEVGTDKAAYDAFCEEEREKLKRGLIG